MRYVNHNLGKSPFDPDYRHGYDAEDDLALYEQACEEREQQKMEER